uniref:Uncharacterized protein n=1 Tax=Octopus bimaculoides TaxID=37653 RepID=A0A0L8FZ58_OCTBM
MQEEALLLIRVQSEHPPDGPTSEDSIFFPALNKCSLLASVSSIVCPSIIHGNLNIQQCLGKQIILA